MMTFLLIVALIGYVLLAISAGVLVGILVETHVSRFRFDNASAAGGAAFAVVFLALMVAGALFGVAATS